MNENGPLYFEKATEDDYISNVMEKTQDFYERVYLDHLATFLRPGEVVIDVGANIGNHSIYFAALCQSRVVAYEPVDRTAKTLAVNTSLNACETLIDIRQNALGGSARRAEVERYSSDNVGATRLRLDDSGTLEVKALDDEDLPRPVKVIKIDAEGMDIDVLAGSAKIIAKDRPIIGCEAADQPAQSALKNWCRENNYTVYGVYNATPTYILIPSGSMQELIDTARVQGESLQTVRDEMRAIRWQLRLIRESLEAQTS